MTGTFPIDLSKTRDLAPEVLDEHGRLRILPASYWASTTPDERGLLCHRHGLYGLPTVELVEHLTEVIGGQRAIEIGAGHGALAKALDIPGTDSREQERPEYQLLFGLQGTPPVTYGPDVIEMHASRAVRRYRPQVVIACWVTQNYRQGEPWNHDSKLDGVDEEDILRHCETYILIGNEKIHRGKRIWARPHTIEYPPWLYSRAMNGSRDFIATWQGTGVGL